MPLKFLIDENLRGKFLGALIERGQHEGLPVDVVESGGEGAPLLSTQDPELLDWLEQNQRVMITLDENTMPMHLANHLARGGSCPGILIVRRGFSWEQILEFLVLYGAVTRTDECMNQCIYIPY